MLIQFAIRLTIAAGKTYFKTYLILKAELLYKKYVRFKFFLSSPIIK